jgi:hypothetical protein
VIPSAADRNGPVTASLRARGSSLQRRPERLQLRDGHDTVLLDLDWADWFGGDPGGVERLCAEAGVAPPGDVVLDDDLPEVVRPWGGEQAGRTTPAVGWSRSAFAYFAVLQVAIATTAGTQARWPIWPGWAAVVALLLTGVLPWVARRWWGRRLVPTPVTTSAPAGAWER